MRRWFVPEIIQTSAMDCGPAALKTLLDGFGSPSAMAACVRPARRRSRPLAQLQQLAEVLGCTTDAARMHAVRRKWPRRASNRIGEPAHVLVPEDVVVRGRAMHAGEQFNAPYNEQCDAPVQANGRATSDAQDNATLAIRALESAVEGLREQLAVTTQQLAVTNERADRADRRLEVLQAALDAKSRELAAMKLTETPRRRPCWSSWPTTMR